MIPGVHPGKRFHTVTFDCKQKVSLLTLVLGYQHISVSGGGNPWQSAGSENMPIVSFLVLQIEIIIGATHSHMNFFAYLCKFATLKACRPGLQTRIECVKFCCQNSPVWSFRIAPYLYLFDSLLRFINPYRTSESSIIIFCGKIS